MKRNKTWLVVIVVLGFALIAVGCSKEEATGGTQEQAIAVEAKPGTVQVRVEGPSMVEPYRTQTIRARIEGIVVEGVAEGDLVTEDAVLVRFDPADQQKTVRQAELNLRQARINAESAAARLKTTGEDLESKRKLFESGALAQEQVTAAHESLVTARYGLDLANINVSQAQLALEIALGDRDAAVVKAPFAGVVTKSTLNPGDLVSKGGILLELADVSQVRLRAEVDEFDISKVSVGQGVSITSEALGEMTLRSKVERVSPAAEVVNNISIFLVSTVLANTEGQLKPGMSADMSILISSDKGLIVPSKAVSTVRTRSYLKVFTDGEVETRRVTAGADDGINVAILEGLEDGELVVLPSTGGLTLTSGETSTGTTVVPISVPGMRMP